MLRFGNKMEFHTFSDNLYMLFNANVLGAHFPGQHVYVV